MRYKSIRLITKTESIDVMKQLLEKVDGKSLADIIENANINKQYGDIVYIGWDYLHSRRAKLIEDAMIELEEQELSYRLTVLDDAVVEIEELSYTSPEDEEKNIPYPSIIKSFDEDDVEAQLKGYDNYINKTTKEIDDYEHSI